MEINVTLSPEVTERVSEDDLAQLDLSVRSLIKAGVLIVDNESDVVVDMDVFREVALGSTAIQEGYKTYGQDTQGFVKYPFMPLVDLDQ